MITAKTLARTRYRMSADLLWSAIHLAISSRRMHTAASPGSICVVTWLALRNESGRMVYEPACADDPTVSRGRCVRAQESQILIPSDLLPCFHELRLWVLLYWSTIFETEYYGMASSDPSSVDRLAVCNVRETVRGPHDGVDQNDSAADCL